MSAGVRAGLLAGALCLLVLALDQGTKALAEASIAPGERMAGIGPLELTLAHNRGAAFGLGGGAAGGLVLFGLVALVLVGYVFARRPTQRGMWVAVGLVAGGALGNLVDRVRIGAVTDFIDLPRWPPFNLADVAIVVGVLLLASTALREERG